LRLGYSFAFVCAQSLCSARLLAQPTTAAPADDSEIAAALREQAHRAHVHRYVWTGVNGALALGSFAVLPVVDRASRPDFVVGGVGSLLGTVATFAFPLRVESAAVELDAAERLPPEARQRKLHELLRADADDERDRLGLPWHALNLGASLLAGGIIAFGFHHALSGVTQGVGSFVLGEAQLFTQPTRLEGYEVSDAVGAARFQPRISIQSRYMSIGLIGTW
jgi:hypothetical protein